jgi:hypothetical protein
VTEVAKRWHVGSWGPLGAVETLLKGAAFACAFVALAVAAGSGWERPGGAELAQTLLLALAELGLAIAVYDRVMEREITAMAFVVVNNLAHLAIVLALLAERDVAGYVTAFAGLMLAGELVKIAFLRRTAFTVRGHDPALLVAGTAGYAALYAAVLVLALA